MSGAYEEKKSEYDKYLDMEYIVQSDDAWTEAPLMGVKMALHALKLQTFSPQPQLAEMALEFLSRYGNLEEMRRLGLREEYIKTLYQMNYGGDRDDEEESEWGCWYREDLRSSLDGTGPEG